jgi:hypothetical protein
MTRDFDEFNVLNGNRAKEAEREREREREREIFLPK